MGKNSIFGITHRLIVCALACSIVMPCYAFANLPEPELIWKNSTVNGKKSAVYTLYCDHRGIMWIGSNNGLYFYDGVNSHPVGRNGLAGVQIYAIVEKGNVLYLGSNAGLWLYDYSTGKVFPAHKDAPKEIRSLLLVDNRLYIGSLYGFYQLELSNNTLTDISEGLPHKSVYSILRDSRGIFYLGTYNGLARWSDAGDNLGNKAANRFTTVSSNIFVNCIMEAPDHKSILVGSEGALFKYSPTTDNWTTVTALVGNNIKSLSKTDKSILVGTDKGVYRITGENINHCKHDSRKGWTLSDNEIWCVYSDSENNVWAGHERGFSIASNSASIRTIKLSTLANSGEGNDIYSIYRDSYGSLWFGGSNGIIHLDKDGNNRWYRHDGSKNTLSHNRIRSIYESRDGGIWLSTDGGINKYNYEKDCFDVFHVADSSWTHKSNWVYAIAEDGEYFWIGSYLGGLHRVYQSKFKENKDTIVSDFVINAETSLGNTSLTNDFVNNIIRDKNGNLWILLFRDGNVNRLSPDGKLWKYNVEENTGHTPASICMDDNGRIWCAYNGGVMVFRGNEAPHIIQFPYTSGDEAILAIGKVGEDIWVSTMSNVWKVDGNTYEASLLPIPQKSYMAIYEDPRTGMVLLGGSDEILEVDQSKLDSALDHKSIKLVLNDHGNGLLKLSDLKEGAKGLTIPYGGGLTLVVSTLDYSPESAQRYMYKLAESEADSIDGWVVMPEGANVISLSDLKMGDYKILIKIIGSPETPMSIPLTVQAPWTLSWWAISIYIVFIILMIWMVLWYIKKRNQRLFQEEERKTALENVEKKLTFLSTISHDFKTPLSMILGPVSLMKEKTSDPEAKHGLETIYENAVRLNNMIHRTLELNQFDESGENLLILSTFDVVEFCKSAFESFKENHPNKNFIFHTDYSQLLIEADAVKFESVITNILSNACKYSDEGSTISCGIGCHGDNVEIVISDDGIGIAEIDQPLVFQRMFRAPSSAKLREGTGLGLYLIKKYLELMNGNINLYSKEGQGTSFIVTLPLTENDKDKSLTVENEEDSDKPKILVVEDNQQIKSFIVNMLKNDYKVLAAENGRSGLAIASSFTPDLIVVDEMMPIMTGLEMCKRLKQNPRLMAVPIVMLTAKSDNITENESIKLGIDIFMGKPFEPTVLLARISHLLKVRAELKESVRIQTITEAKPIEAESLTEKQLAKIAKILEDNISDPDLNVNTLCEKCAIPQKQLYRIIKKYIGISPLDYIRRVRLQKAAMLLSQRRFTISEICYMVGFKTPSYFSKCFQAQYGVKPSQYQSDDENMGSFRTNNA